MSRDATTSSQVDSLSPLERWCVLAAAFAGWMFAGLQISLFVLVARPALRDLLPSASEADIGDWFAWLALAGLVLAIGQLLRRWRR